MNLDEQLRYWFWVHGLLHLPIDEAIELCSKVNGGKG
jgi:hypothetical protein